MFFWSADVITLCLYTCFGFRTRPLASGGGFHLRYGDDDNVTPADKTQLLAVHLVRSNGSPALTGHSLIETLPQQDLIFAGDHFVASGRQVFSMVDAANLDPGDLPRQPSGSRLRLVDVRTRWRFSAYGQRLRPLPVYGRA